MTLADLIAIAGVLHFGLLIASALTPGVLRWRSELRQLSALSRHVVWVHGAFIVAVIVGLGTISILNASCLAGGSELARSICAFMSLFWLGRLVVQLFLFDARPYLRGPVLKLGYRGLTVVFTYFTIVYGWAALWPHYWPASAIVLNSLH
jgi:hypothetical protein